MFQTFFLDSWKVHMLLWRKKGEEERDGRGREREGKNKKEKKISTPLFT